jgi:3-hydroxybutyryl-CoA dehydrogenase
MHIAIVGVGSTGAEIVRAVAPGGETILLHDTDEKTLRLALAYVSRALDRAVEQGQIDSMRARRVKRSFVLTTDLKRCAAADVIIEAVQDKPAAKEALLQALDSLVRPDALLATTTNRLSITRLAAATRLPDRVIGLHFCRPVQNTRVVEVVRTPTTRQDLIDQAAALIKRSGRTAVIVPDNPGLIVNRMAQMVFGEALRLLDSGGGLDEKTIDQLIEAAGFAAGPFHLMDQLGIDKVLEVATTLYDATFHDLRYRPHPRQQRMVDAGLLGSQSARGGFYPPAPKKDH